MVCAEVLRAHRDPQSRTSLPAQLKRDDFVEFLSGLGQQCIDDDRMPRELHTFVSRMYLELLFEQLALGDEVLETDYALTLLGQHRKFRVLPRNHCWPDGRADGARAVITEQRLLGPSRIKAKIHVEEGDTLTALSLPQKLSDGTVRMHCDAKGVVGWVTVRTNMGTKLVAPFSQINMRLEAHKEGGGAHRLLVPRRGAGALQRQPREAGPVHGAVTRAAPPASRGGPCLSGLHHYDGVRGGPAGASGSAEQNVAPGSAEARRLRGVSLGTGAAVHRR
mmetsp:Transcript_20426/g.53641  ORF Transcript_20426/g.53641 Transcript_20426/m.53641 type:complete len:278 (+) Transcript_20426:186-1019(+)